MFDDPFPHHDFENPDCNPFASFKQRSGHRKFEGAAQVLGHKSMSPLYFWTGIPEVIDLTGWVDSDDNFFYDVRTDSYFSHNTRVFLNDLIKLQSDET